VLNCNEYTFNISENIVVPEPKNPIAFPRQAAVTNEVLRRVAMLATVNFDDQTLLPTDKIANVSGDRDLANELVTFQLSVTNPVPKHRLRICLIDAEPPCDSDGPLI